MSIHGKRATRAVVEAAMFVSSHFKARKPPRDKVLREHLEQLALALDAWVVWGDEEIPAGADIKAERAKADGCAEEYLARRKGASS